MKKVNITVQNNELKLLLSLGEKPTTMAEMCFSNFLYLRISTLIELKNKFSDNELKSMIDGYNGTMYSPDWASKKGAFIAHTEDAAKFEGPDQKWKINTNDLVKKLNNLSAAQILVLQFELFRFWDIKESYNRDIDNFVTAFNY